MNDAPERKLLTPNGGLPTGGWDESDLITYIREDLHTADIRAARREAYAQAMEDAAKETDCGCSERDGVLAGNERCWREPCAARDAAHIRALPNPYEADT